jgi:hypothetical protein
MVLIPATEISRDTIPTLFPCRIVLIFILKVSQSFPPPSNVITLLVAAVPIHAIRAYVEFILSVIIFYYYYTFHMQVFFWPNIYSAVC